MSQPFQAPRGTRDLLPDDYALHMHVLAAAREQARLAGFGFIEPPTFEHAELFARGVGEGTDIVEKEMYLFEDRGGDRLALRPEGTASVCRAYLQHGMSNLPQPVKLAYHLPIFRYERPQAGRFRQHTQFGVEAIGVRDPALDAEVIDLGWRTAQSLGLKDLVILLNSIGDVEDRRAYLPRLKAHFEPHLDQIAPDDQARFERAPMRLLDSKDDRTRPFQSGAPIITEHLRPESAAFYESVKLHLTALGIPFEERPTLVRGLDYYTHTVFEIVPSKLEGSQVTVLAGGRYDGLIEQIGGPPTPGIRLRHGPGADGASSARPGTRAGHGAATRRADRVAGRRCRSRRIADRRRAPASRNRGDARLRRPLAAGPTSPGQSLRRSLRHNRGSA